MRVAIILIAFSCGACGEDGPAIDAGVCVVAECGADAAFAGSWRGGSDVGNPSPRCGHTAVWTGDDMIIWGGRRVGRDCQDGPAAYNPDADSWRALPDDGIPCAYEHTAVWTGEEMIVWGGHGGLGDPSAAEGGAAYDPAFDSWRPVSRNGQPSPRWRHNAVWTGTEMIVWGGVDDYTYVNTGGIYDPIADEWHSMTTTGAPEGRADYSAVWTGSEMIVWGGTSANGGVPRNLNDGGAYDPIADSWRPLARHGVEQSAHQAIWTGTEMVIWGKRYDPELDEWRCNCSQSGYRAYYTQVWTGSYSAFWGGTLDGERPPLNAMGLVYDPQTEQRYGIEYGPLLEGPSSRAVWTGDEVIIWGGCYGSSYTNWFALYRPPDPP